MLARREHSSQELLSKLVTKGYAGSVAGETVAALEREGLVSDERFTEMLLNARRGRGYGPLRIRHELKEKGVSADTINRWLDVASPEWVEQVQLVRLKRFGGHLPRSYAERVRQMRFLQHRGFTRDQIELALRPDDSH